MRYPQKLFFFCARGQLISHTQRHSSLPFAKERTSESKSWQNFSKEERVLSLRLMGGGTSRKATEAQGYFTASSSQNKISGPLKLHSEYIQVLSYCPREMKMTMAQLKCSLRSGNKNNVTSTDLSQRKPPKSHTVFNPKQKSINSMTSILHLH